MNKLIEMKAIDKYPPIWRHLTTSERCALIDINNQKRIGYIAGLTQSIILVEALKNLKDEYYKLNKDFIAAMNLGWNDYYQKLLEAALKQADEALSLYNQSLTIK